MVMGAGRLFGTVSSSVGEASFVGVISSFHARCGGGRSLRIMGVHLNSVVSFVTFSKSDLGGSTRISFCMGHSGGVGSRVRVECRHPRGIRTCCNYRVGHLKFYRDCVTTVLRDDCMCERCSFHDQGISIIDLGSVVVPCIPLSVRGMFSGVVGCAGAPRCVRDDFFMGILSCVIRRIVGRGLFGCRGIELVGDTVTLRSMPSRGGRRFVSGSCGRVVRRHNNLVRRLVTTGNMGNSLRRG